MTHLTTIKQGARKTWAEGEYLALSRFLPPASAHLVKAAGVAKGKQVLDVACGTGVTAITAARRGADVAGLDLTPDLLVVAKDEAALAEAPDIQWQEGDAEAMPYADDAFDIVLSSFGHMFTPDPAAAARELIRVTKPGGCIAFATWPPESAVGQIFKAIGALVAPPPGTVPPSQWGVEKVVRERLGDAVRDVRFERGTVSWPMLSSGHLWALFRDTYGPFIMALAKLDTEPVKQKQLADDVKAIFESFYDENEIRFDYLLTVATKK